MHHPSKRQFYKISGLLRTSGIWLDFNFLHWKKFHWAAFRKACVLDRSVGDFGQSVLMTPERPLPVALKEHLRVLLHWCASIAGLPCSPPSHRNITSDGTLLLCTLMEVEGYPGQRKRHKITQLASPTKTWSGKPHATTLCHCITPSECSRIVSGTNFAKTAKLPWSLQFLFYLLFFDIFSILGTRRVWAWLNHHQVRIPFFYNKWWTVLFVFFFFFFFFM